MADDRAERARAFFHKVAPRTALEIVAAAPDVSEVVKASLRANAAAVIFAHNHPSGVAQPSQADEILTRNLKEALSLVDVKVLDHFIVAGTQAISFAERGLL